MKYLTLFNVLLLTAVLLAFVSPFRISAQTPPLIWQHCYGGDSTDYINCVKQTADGGYIAAGSTRSVNGDLAGNGGVKGLWVLKLDAGGNIQWEKTYSDTLFGASYIEPTYDGGYILTGSQTIKLHNDGSIEWLDNMEGNTIHQTTDSGYLLTNGNYPGISKLHPDGSIDWQQNYSSSTSVTGVGDACRSFTNGYIVAGTDFPISHPTPFFGKTDNSGNLTLPIYDIGGHSAFAALCKMNNGTYLFADNLVYTNTSEITNFSDSLTTSWYVSSARGVTGITATADNGFAVWGGRDTATNMMLFKFDSAHSQQWSVSFPGTQSDQPANVLQIANGNYVVAASISPNDVTTPGNHGGFDGWIAELGYNTSVPAVKTNTADIKVYPVPATRQLFIDLPPGYQNAILKLIDVSGNTLIEENSNTLNRILGLTHFAAGQYLLAVINNGSYSSYKVVHY